MSKDENQLQALKAVKFGMLFTSNLRLLVWIACILICPRLVYAEGVQLVHKSNPKRTKTLSATKVYTVVTKDTTYYSLIVGLNDEGLLLLKSVKSGKDTAISVYNQILKRDTVYIRPLYHLDTVVLPLADIYCINRPWIGEAKYLEPVGWIFIGAVMGIVGLPVSAIQGGSGQVSEWFKFEMILLSASVPFILVAGLKKEFDLRKKWKIEKRMTPHLKGSKVS